jgi:hypothetical protein
MPNPFIDRAAMAIWLLGSIHIKSHDESFAVSLKFSEDMDWRTIDPSVYTWKAGIKELKAAHEKIISILKTKDDEFLSGAVDEREYNTVFY